MDDSKKVQSQHLAKLIVLDTSMPQQTYILKSGMNIIGRKANSTAHLVDFPITTKDNKMSRAHICIEVSQRANGKLKYLLSDHIARSENAYRTKILNDKCVIEKGDKVHIYHGDIILLGKTKVKLEILGADNSNTSKNIFIENHSKTVIN